MSDERPKSILSITWLSAYVVGVPYVVGYLIVTIHLANFNVSPPDLIRLQYIVAGVWSILPWVVIVYPIVWMAALLQHSYEESVAANIAVPWRRLLVHARRISYSFVSAAGWCLMIFALFSWIIGNRLHTTPGAITSSEIFKFLGITAILAAAIAFFLYVSSQFFKQIDVLDFKTFFSHFVWGCGFGFVGLATLMAYIFYFAINMYGKIPSYIGGGAPVPVYVYLKDRPNRLLSADPVLTSGTYLLLTSTEHSIYLLSPDERQALIISREIVEAIEFKQFSFPASGEQSKVH